MGLLYSLHEWVNHLVDRRDMAVIVDATTRVHGYLQNMEDRIAALEVKAGLRPVPGAAPVTETTNGSTEANRAGT